MTFPTDGWAFCALGHRHWGRAGAAGLLLHRDDVVLVGLSVDDHGGWSYTTVLARPARPIDVGDLHLDGESAGAAWLPLAGLDEVDLHPGLAASLSRLRSLLRHAGA